MCGLACQLVYLLEPGPLGPVAECQGERPLGDASHGVIRRPGQLPRRRVREIIPVRHIAVGVITELLAIDRGGGMDVHTAGSGGCRPHCRCGCNKTPLCGPHSGPRG